MKRRLRNNSVVPISLFSFQDILTTIMGILILMTLMMALDLWRTSSVIPDEVRGTIPSLAQSGRIEDLRKREEELRLRYDSTLAAVSRLAAFGADSNPRIQQEIAALKQTQDRVRELESEVRRLQMEMTTTSTALGGAQERINELVRIEQQIARLDGEINQLRHNPRLTYLVQAGATKRPVLLELSKDRVGIGTPDAANSVLWFANRNGADLARLIIKVASNYNSTREYFVVLLKPSAFSLHEEVVGGLQLAGFEVGTELIGEDDAVLVRPGKSDEE